MRNLILATLLISLAGAESANAQLALVFDKEGATALNIKANAGAYVRAGGAKGGTASIDTQLQRSDYQSSEGDESSYTFQRLGLKARVDANANGDLDRVNASLEGTFGGGSIPRIAADYFAYTSRLRGDGVNYDVSPADADTFADLLAEDQGNQSVDIMPTALVYRKDRVLDTSELAVDLSLVGAQFSGVALGDSGISICGGVKAIGVSLGKTRVQKSKGAAFRPARATLCARKKLGQKLGTLENTIAFDYAYLVPGDAHGASMVEVSDMLALKNVSGSPLGAYVEAEYRRASDGQGTKKSASTLTVGIQSTF